MHLPVLAGLLLARFMAAEELPPPEATEQWTPVPAVITAPAGSVPSDAVVLFDGKNLDAWEPVRPGESGWRIEDGAMVVVPNPKPCDQRTKTAFGDIQLHLEFRSPAKVEGAGQDGTLVFGNTSLGPEPGPGQQRDLFHGALRIADPRFLAERDLRQWPGGVDLQATAAAGERQPAPG